MDFNGHDIYKIWQYQYFVYNSELLPCYENRVEEFDLFVIARNEIIKN